MYQMIKSNGLSATISQEAPAGLVAFVVAEFFYKFHSFALECIAFLITWIVLSWLAGALSSLVRGRAKETIHE